MKTEHLSTPSAKITYCVIVKKLAAEICIALISRYKFIFISSRAVLCIIDD